MLTMSTEQSASVLNVMMELTIYVTKGSEHRKLGISRRNLDFEHYLKIKRFYRKEILF
jgi:hypothetical protein